MRNLSILKIWIISLVALILSSCEGDPGTTRQRLNGNEPGLPEELKGLKVYSVFLNEGGIVKVAVLNNKINSTTYSSGKTQSSTLMIEKNTNRIINIANIISENDSIIVAKKE